MARFVFEATYSTIDDAAFLHTGVKESHLERKESLKRYTVSGIAQDHELEALGLWVMNAASLQEFTVNRILAEYTTVIAAADRLQEMVDAR